MAGVVTGPVVVCTCRHRGAPGRRIGLVGRRSTPKPSKQGTSPLGPLAPAERAEVLDRLLIAHPELNDEAERIAIDLLSAVSVDQVASEVESALVWIPLDALAARAGRVRGRGYVHETEAAWELVDDALEPFRSDLDRRAALGLLDSTANLTVGIIAGLYRARDPKEGTVLAYAGEDTLDDISADIVDLAAQLGVTIPNDAPETHWPGWSDLW